MTFETYYPEQRHMLEMTLIRRERLMPETVREVRVEVPTGARITLKDVVARGTEPAPYTVIEAARQLHLRKAGELEKHLQVAVGDLVTETMSVASRGRRRALSPVSGKVVAIEDGRVIVQATAESIELEAGLNGQVVEAITGRGVILETLGAVLQGVWGNGRRVIGTLQMEPADGLEVIDTDELDMQYRGAIVITRKPLRQSQLAAMADQGYVGVIAPSMESHSIGEAMSVRQAILLTEGFGPLKMTPQIGQFLDEHSGRQGTLDAALPEPGERRRPELLINVPVMNTYERPAAPLTHVTLQAGMQVRVVRIEGDGGIMGQVVALPKMPIALENGLRVPCAQVEFATGERSFVPLANIEIFGR